jgi:TRAP transporter TAXI family solute receptor
MYATPGLFAVKLDSPVRTIEDLRGRAVALGTRGSGLTILGRRVLSALGLDPDDGTHLEQAGDGPEMVRTGRVAALWGGGTGWPGFTALAAAPEGARFIGPSEDGISRILTVNPTMRRLTVPAGTYRGQDAAITTVGSWSLILSRSDLDERVAFRLARALDLGRAAMSRRLPQAAEATIANTIAAVPRSWLHPGTARYLSQAGHALN